MVQERIEQIFRDMMAQQNPRTSMPLPSVLPADRRRSRGSAVDNGTVALALGSMAMYWVLPAMLAGNRRRRRARRAAPPPQSD
ncbi:MAG: hypothetical protein ACSLFM_02815 [Tepidiformaceae bacterium]